MNVYDSARISDVLAVEGYKPTQHAKDADLVILNTCHIREKAVNKVYSELGRLKSIKKPEALIAVGGCVAQAEGIEISHRAPAVDFVFGPQNYHKLPSMLTRAIAQIGKKNKHQRIIETNFPAESKFEFLPNVTTSSSSAFLTIQEGCDKFCKFCVVPYTRGAEFSRLLEDVLKEAAILVNSGAKELILLGQNVNAYHGCKGGLSKLLQALAKIDGLKRVRYTTSHPSDFDSELIKAHGDIPKLMPFLHLPVQSGSDRILKNMNRRHTIRDYMELIENLRNVRPDISFSSDFIVGYPGETDKDFAATISLIKHVEFSQGYSFKFSKRPGTPAADMNKQVPEKIKDERLSCLQTLLHEKQTAFNKNSMGKTIPVLLDRYGKKANQLIGRTPHMQAVHLNCSSLKQTKKYLGKITSLGISATYTHSLTGHLETNSFNKRKSLKEYQPV